MEHLFVSRRVDGQIEARTLGAARLFQFQRYCNGGGLLRGDIEGYMGGVGEVEIAEGPGEERDSFAIAGIADFDAGLTQGIRRGDFRIGPGQRNPLEKSTVKGVDDSGWFGGAAAGEDFEIVDPQGVIARGVEA